MKRKSKSASIKDSVIHKFVKKRRITQDNTGSSTINRALKNIKEAFKKKDPETKPLIASKQVVQKHVKPQKKAKTKEKGGIVYLGHIPHGFYEEQMADYFKQFGKVRQVRVARSKNTGRSRGYGYVEFIHPDVAKIAAESMNNYLMCGRLLKAKYIAPEDQHGHFFRGTTWTKQKYPKLIQRRKTNKLKDREINDVTHERFVQRTLKQLANLEKKLKEKGIDLKFQPVDAPEVK